MANVYDAFQTLRSDLREVVNAAERSLEGTDLNDVLDRIESEVQDARSEIDRAYDSLSDAQTAIESVVQLIEELRD